MGSLAVITLIGNVGSDPDIKKAGNADICTFSLAINRRRGREDFTDWYRCITFQEGLIDLIMKYVKKGSSVAVSGEVGIQKWEADDRTERTTVEVRIQQFTLNDPPPGGGRDAGRGSDRRDDRGRDDRGREDRSDRAREGGRDTRRDDRGRASSRDDRSERAREGGGGRDDRGYDRGERAREGARDDRGRDTRREEPARGTRAPAGGSIDDDEIPF